MIVPLYETFRGGGTVASIGLVSEFVSRKSDGLCIPHLDGVDWCRIERGTRLFEDLVLLPDLNGPVDRSRRHGRYCLFPLHHPPLTGVLSLRLDCGVWTSLSQEAA